MPGLSIGIGLDRRPPAGAAAPAPLLPALAAAPRAAWGLQTMVSGYAGPLATIRRPSDNATLDVVATSTGNPDWAAVPSWAGSPIVSLARAYDQTGGGAHLVPPAGSEPVIDLSQVDASGRACALIGLVGDWLGAAIGVDRLDYSLFHAFQLATGAGLAAFSELHDGSNVLDSLIYGNGPVGLQLYSASGGLVVLTPPLRHNPVVFGVTGTAASRRLYQSETNFTAAAQGAGIASQVNIGKLSGFGFNQLRRWWGSALYPALSVSDGTLLQQRMAAMFGVPTTFDRRLVIDGDSIAAGSSGITNGKTIMWLAMRAGLLDGQVELFNLSIGGTTLQDHYNGRAARLSTYTAAFGARCGLLIQAGTNDIGQGTRGDDLYENVTKPFVAAANAAGFRTSVASLEPRTDGPYQAELNAYRAKGLANTAGAYLVFDVGDPATIMGNPATPAQTSPRYYAEAPGGIHPNDAGALLLAPEWAAAINALLA